MMTTYPPYNKWVLESPQIDKEAFKEKQNLIFSHLLRFCEVGSGQELLRTSTLI